MRSKFSSTSCRYRKNKRARSTGGVSRHAGNASAAAFTARSTCSFVHAGTSAMTSPRDGLKTGVRSTPEISRHSPSINAGQDCIVTRSAARERIGLFYEIVAAPFAVRADDFLCCSRSIRSGFIFLFALLLHAHKLGVRGEIIETLAFEIVQRFKLLLHHELQELVAHALYALVTKFHYAGANLRRVGPEQDEL